jgi:hypothetical protein
VIKIGIDRVALGVRISRISWTINVFRTVC